MQDGGRDVGCVAVGGLGQAERAEDLLLEQHVEPGPGDLLDGGAEQDEVGVRVVPVGAGVVPAVLPGRDGDQFLGRPLPERVRVHRLAEAGAGDVVGQASGGVAEHPQGDALGVRQVGQPARHRGVEVDRALVDQPQQERAQVADRDVAVAEVHRGLGRYARHRLAERARDDLPSVDGDPQDHRLEVHVRLRLLGDPHDVGRPAVRGQPGRDARPSVAVVVARGGGGRHRGDEGDQGGERGRRGEARHGGRTDGSHARSLGRNPPPASRSHPRPARRSPVRPAVDALPSADVRRVTTACGTSRRRPYGRGGRAVSDMRLRRRTGRGHLYCAGTK